MMRGIVVTLLLATAYGKAVDLNDKNFEAEVIESGKAAFVKFLAPW